MRRNIRIIELSVVALLLFYSLFFLINESRRTPYNRDEISWFFHTKFFEELFLKKNFHPSIWESYEGYDHPQLSKYIFGGYLFLRSPAVFDQRDQLEKEYGRWQFYFDPRLTDISVSPFRIFIDLMRDVNVIITWLTIGLLILLLHQLTVPFLLGGLLILVLVHNQLFLESMLRAISDSHMIFFFVLSIVCYNQYIQSSRRNWLIAFAVSLGLSISSKLTGALLIIPFALYELFIKRSFRSFGVAVVISFTMWFIVNPTLYTSPIGSTVEFFAFRIRQSVILQEFFPQVALTSVGSRVSAVIGAIFQWGVVSILLPGIGLVTLIKRMIQRDFVSGFVTAVVLVTAISISLYIPLNSDRYFLPLIMVTFICFSVGIWSLVKIIIQPRRL